MLAGDVPSPPQTQPGTQLSLDHPPSRTPLEAGGAEGTVNTKNENGLGGGEMRAGYVKSPATVCRADMELGGSVQLVR